MSPCSFGFHPRWFISKPRFYLTLTTLLQLSLNILLENFLAISLFLLLNRVTKPIRALSVIWYPFPTHSHIHHYRWQTYSEQTKIFTTIACFIHFLRMFILKRPLIRDPFNVIGQSHFEEVHSHERNSPPGMEPSVLTPMLVLCTHWTLSQTKLEAVSCVFNIYFNLIFPPMFLHFKRCRLFKTFLIHFV
jgi:hypothetical protein